MGSVHSDILRTQAFHFTSQKLYDSVLNLVQMPEHSPCSSGSQLQLRAWDPKNWDRKETGGRNREAALDRTHAKGGKLQMPTRSVPNLWDRWEDAPMPRPRFWELQKHTFLERFLSGDLTQLPILS